MKKFIPTISNLNHLELNPHNIILCYTSEIDYSMDRIMLLEGIYNAGFILVEGGHCSCYDFDETEWDATEYTRDELIALSKAEYNKNSTFWKMVSNYFNQ